jgi:pilus assembly protein CpaC
MGINLNVISPSGNFGVQQIAGLAPIADLVRTFSGTSFTQSPITSITAMTGFMGGGLLWTMFFQVLKQNNLGRLLAEPNLVTTSGKEASFLAGGEIAVPVPQSGVGGGTTVTIDWKKFGTQLTFTPTVLDDGKIAMKVAPEVSALDYSIAITLNGTTIPGIRTRSMSTHLEVKDGQTFAMAGLLQDIDSNVINKFPVLGDLPILGNLFRSSQWQNQQTELVVLVTPHIAKPLAPNTARLPTDKWVAPSDAEKYLLGLNQGRPQVTAPLTATPPSQEPPAGFGMQKLE